MVAPTQSVTARASNQANAQGGTATAQTAPIYIPYPQQSQFPMGNRQQQAAPEPAPKQFSLNTGFGTYGFTPGQAAGTGTYGTNFGEVGVGFIPGGGITGYNKSVGGVNYGFTPGQAAGTGSYSVPTDFNSSYAYTPGKTGPGQGQFTYGVTGMGDAYGGYDPEASTGPINPSVWSPTPAPYAPVASSQNRSYGPMAPPSAQPQEPQLDVRGRIINPNLKEQQPTGGPFGTGMDVPTSSDYAPDPTAGRMYRPPEGFPQDAGNAEPPRTAFEAAVHALGDGEPVPYQSVPEAVSQIQDSGIVPPGVLRQADYDALGLYLAGVSTQRGLAAARVFAQYLLGLPAGAFMGHP